MQNKKIEKIEMTEKYLKEFKKEAKEWFIERSNEKNGFYKKFYEFYKKEFGNNGFLSKNNIRNLKYENLKEFVDHTHSFNSVDFAKRRAVNTYTVEKYGIKHYGEQFYNLIFSKGKLSGRINKAIENLYGFSISSVSEIVAWASYFVPYNKKYVFYNKRDQNIMKFFGLAHKHKRGTKIGQKFVVYNEIIENKIKNKYEKIVGKQTEYETELEIDQFFSWLYEKLKEEEVKEISEIDICYLDELKIKNFFNVNIELAELKDKKEIYFLGENAHGKTLILQSILIALTKNYIHTYTKKETTGKILDLINENKECKFAAKGFDDENKLEIPFSYKEIKNEKSKKSDKIKDHFLKNIFAYGVFRSGASVRKDLKDSYEYGFMTLFDEQDYLIHPIQWLNETDRKQSILNLKLESVLKLLSKIFRNEIEVKKDKETFDFYFCEKNSDKKLNFEQMSAGYKTVLIWTCDLLARLAKNQPEVRKIENYKGIVLIDEVDLFLHPKWEYEIVSILRKKFAGIQFFFTTHSAIAVLGAGKDAVFYKVYKENGETKTSKSKSDISNLMANSVITSPLFGMEKAYSRAFNKEKEVLRLGDDYIYDKIHDFVVNEIKKKNNVEEKDIMTLIRERYNKIKAEK